MRKRDRARIAKKLQAFLDDLAQNAKGQLEGAIWYFERDAEIKGFNSAYASSEWARVVGERIKKFLDEERKRLGK